MTGNVKARCKLGINEEVAGNFDRALKHHMIAVTHEYNDSLKQVKRLYTHGHATKEDYTKALQSYQTYLGMIKSRQKMKRLHLIIRNIVTIRIRMTFLSSAYARITISSTTSSEPKCIETPCWSG